jgi:hypothetical protein
MLTGRIGPILPRVGCAASAFEADLAENVVTAKAG